MLLCYSANHRTTGFDELGRLERGADGVIARLADCDLIAGSVVLSTCNRFEAYLEVPDGTSAQAREATLAAIGASADMPVDEVHGAGALLVGDAVVEHVFAVASGLESIVVGEGEIAGQVRRALESARSRGTVTRELERVFQRASRASRGVQSRTALSQAGRSVVRLALDLAEGRITDWAQTRVLLVGTGRYAGASLAALRARGVRTVQVFSRTGRAAGFAASHGIAAATDLESAVADSDLIVACSVAPQVILDAATVASARRRPAALPRRLIIDLGLPRNVDPSVAQLPDVELLDLETIGAHAEVPELAETAQARALVDEAVADYRRASAEDAVTPALVALRRHVFDVLDGEIAWARRRGDSSPQTEAALRHLAGVLLHTPSVRARELAAQGRADDFGDAISALFGLSARSCPVTDIHRAVS
ncbi:glutamyl-tRNA reductase [Microbacterium kribbense]|uniref:Glutamyl-tRNA reductase n=1 Tax=Microbacterium kribbense TaxID=433645 RepID=A0ABP7G5A8_9MICO